MQYNKTTTSALAKKVKITNTIGPLAIWTMKVSKDGDAFSRFTTRLNLESNVSKYITVGLNMNFSSRDESAIAVDTKAFDMVFSVL